MKSLILNPLKYYFPNLIWRDRGSDDKEEQARLSKGDSLAGNKKYKEINDMTELETLFKGLDNSLSMVDIEKLKKAKATFDKYGVKFVFEKGKRDIAHAKVEKIGVDTTPDSHI